MLVSRYLSRYPAHVRRLAGARRISRICSVALVVSFIQFFLGGREGGVGKNASRDNDSDDDGDDNDVVISLRDSALCRGSINGGCCVYYLPRYLGTRRCTYLA